MGVQADRCIKPTEVDDKLRWLLDTEGPALLEVVTDKKVPVLPMVPGGKSRRLLLAMDSLVYSAKNLVAGKKKAVAFPC